MTTLYEGTHVGELGSIKLTPTDCTYRQQQYNGGQVETQDIWELESQKRMSAWLARHRAHGWGAPAGEVLGEGEMRT